MFISVPPLKYIISVMTTLCEFSMVINIQCKCVWSWQNRSATLLQQSNCKTCYCQHIHNTLLWAYNKYCCCTYNKWNNSHIWHTWNNPVTYLYRWSWGRWRVSEVRWNCNSKHWVLNVEQQAHWLLIRNKTHQLHHVNDDIMVSDWVKTYRAAPSRVSWQNFGYNIKWSCSFQFLLWII